MRKGISLITLVITIIVMIIIAGVIVISLSSSGIFEQATKAVFVSDIKTIMEEYNIYAAFYMAEGNNIRELNVPVGSVKDVVKAVPDDSIYAEKIAVVNGYLTYMVNVKDKSDVERATWACEAGMKVNGFTGCSDIEFVETHIPAFEKRGKIYYNTPDLTGLNTEKTFFVTYDENGNEVIGNNIGRKAPEDWFDYENKEWANIVVINGNLKTYLVWLPRYAYKVDNNNKVVDVRFVDNNNVYIAEDGTKITYNDTTPVFDENENQTNYVLHSAFNINMGTEESPEMKALSGFWMSKYEVSEFEEINPEIDSMDNEIIVYRCRTASVPTGYYYDFYLNDKLIKTNETGTYTYEGLTPSTVYNVKIILRTGAGVEIDKEERTIKTTGTPTYNEPNAPEIGNLAKKGTYYLTWDANGNEVRTEVVDGNGNLVAAPSNWYNYTNKEWANIVVVNETLGSETYLTWLPRYEYRVLDASSNSSERWIDIAFVPVTKVEATDGYILHTAFDINMGTEENPDIKHLPGFWMSKYEVQDVPVTE